MTTYVCECHDEVEEIFDEFTVEAESRKDAESRAREMFCNGGIPFADYCFFCYCKCVKADD